MDELHGAVPGAIRRDVLTPDVVRDVVRAAVELRAKRPADDRRKALEDELARLERELSRYAEAIAAGDPLPAILEAMRTRERRRQDGRAELDAIAAAARQAPVTEADLYRLLSRRLTDWQGLLERHPPRGREVLQTLLTGRLIVTPAMLDGAVGFEFSGEASYGPLVRGLVGVNGLVPPG